MQTPSARSSSAACLLVALLILPWFAAQAQPAARARSLVYIDIIDDHVYLAPGKDTITRPGDDVYAILDMTDRLGSMHIDLYRDARFRMIKLSGDYAGVPDTLSCRLLVLDEETHLKKYSRFDYFHPLRNGEWKYYNDDGRVWVTYSWQMGKLMRISKATGE